MSISIEINSKRASTDILNALFYLSEDKFIETIDKFYNLDKFYITKITP